MPSSGSRDGCAQLRLVLFKMWFEDNRVLNFSFYLALSQWDPIEALHRGRSTGFH